MNADTTPTYDLMVFIGRFQPFHSGHLSVVKQALKQTKRLLILVGSANVAPDTRNPFTFDQRAAMIMGALDGIDGHVTVMPLNDSPYNPTEWIEDVQHAVKQATNAIRPKVALIGHERDSTSAYLRWFPQFDNVFLDDQGGINATSVRTQLFSDEPDFDSLAKLCPPTTIQYLKQFYQGDAWKKLREECVAEADYRFKWGVGPFVTADAVVIQQGHVLLIRRGRLPGKGALALPGGFLDVSYGETMKEAALRELVEETRIYHGHGAEAQKSMVRPHFKASQVFDDPNRSRRGRIITHAHLFHLPESHALPQVRADDDAAEAMWVPLSEVSPVDMFEDHGAIIREMIKYL